MATLAALLYVSAEYFNYRRLRVDKEQVAGAFVLLACRQVMPLVCVAMKASSGMYIDSADITTFTLPWERHLYTDTVAEFG